MTVVKLIGGINPLDIGLQVLRGSQRPILPNTRDNLLTIPGRAGAWDFGADADSKAITLACAFMTRSPAVLQSCIEELAALLVDGRGRPKTIELIFTSRPDRSFQVRYSGSLSIDRLVGMGQFTLPLIAVDPFPRSITGSDEIILDSDILLDSDFRLDDAWSFNVTAAGSVEVNNWGTLDADPEIVVVGSFSTLSITTNGKTFGYSDAIASKTLVIDCENMTVKLSGVNSMTNMTGDFINLIPGINNVTIGGTGLNCTVSFNFYPRYL